MTSSAHAFAVNPSTIDIVSDRGSVVQEVITIINTKNTEQTYYLNTLSFEPAEDGMTPLFIQNEKDHSGLPEWISFSQKQIRIGAGETFELPFTINVPSDIAAGTYYGALTVSSAPENIIPSGASVEAKTAVLIFLNVSGETTERVALLDFGPTETSSIFSSAPQEFQFRLQNQGTVMVVPSGYVVIKNIFGNEVARLPINEERGRLLPETTRSFSVEWGTDQGETFFEQMGSQWSNGRLGYYTVELDVVFGESTQTKSIGIWIFPWHLLTGFVLFLLIVFLLHKGYVSALRKSSH